MKRRKFTRTDTNFWLDFTLLVVFLVVLWSSVVIVFVFPPGTQADHWSLWGWGYDQWCEFQFSMISIFALCVLVHLMLHWTWVCGVITSRLGTKKSAAAQNNGSRTLLGVGLLIVILTVVGMAVAVAAVAIQGPDYY